MSSTTITTAAPISESEQAFRNGYLNACRQVKGMDLARADRALGKMVAREYRNRERAAKFGDYISAAAGRGRCHAYAFTQHFIASTRLSWAVIAKELARWHDEVVAWYELPGAPCPPRPGERRRQRW